MGSDTSPAEHQPRFYHQQALVEPAPALAPSAAAAAALASAPAPAPQFVHLLATGAGGLGLNPRMIFTLPTVQPNGAATTVNDALAFMASKTFTGATNLEDPTMPNISIAALSPLEHLPLDAIDRNGSKLFTVTVRFPAALEVVIESRWTDPIGITKATWMPTAGFVPVLAKALLLAPASLRSDAYSVGLVNGVGDLLVSLPDDDSVTVYSVAGSHLHPSGQVRIYVLKDPP